MNYINWKDELESFLVDVPYDERQKVFSYFSEMYADKRDAGYSEEEIIAEFGAPYDVARRVLDKSDEDCKMTDDSTSTEQSAATGARINSATPPKGKSTPFTLLRTLLSVISRICIIVVMAGITAALYVAPVAVAACGFFEVVTAIIGTIVSGEIFVGVCYVGLGLIDTGLGFMLIPPFYLLVKHIRKAMTKLLSTIKNALTGGGNV